MDLEVRIARLEWAVQELVEAEKQREKRERSYFIAGLTILGSAVVALVGIIWRYASMKVGL